MKKTLQVAVERPMLMTMTDITYAHIPHWGGYRPLKASVMRPRGDETPRPLLVWICGGGFDTMDKDVWMPEMQYYARRGYVVASVEYRTQNAAIFPALIQDVKAAIRFFRAHAADFGIDPARVAVMGESAGAYIASMVGVTGGIAEFDVGENLQESSAVQAVVDIYGRTYQVRGWHEKVAQGRPRNGTELLMGGKPEDVPEAYEKATVATYIGADAPPFLILHGSADTLVPQVQSDLLYDELVAAGVDADYCVIEGAGHGDAMFYQDAVKAIVLDFLHKHLL